MVNLVNKILSNIVMPHLNGIGATLACLREAAPAKAGRPKGPASRDPIHSPRFSEGLPNILDRSIHMRAVHKKRPILRMARIGLLIFWFPALSSLPYALCSPLLRGTPSGNLGFPLRIVLISRITFHPKFQLSIFG